MQAPVTVITYTHNRDAPRLRNVLLSLFQQSLPVKEVIVIHSGERDRDIKAVSESFDAEYIYLPTPFSIPLAFNVGIKASTQPYVFTCGADTMYSPDTISEVMKNINDQVFVMIERWDLPETAVIDPMQHWQEFKTIGTPRHRICPGALQCAAKDFFERVRGYDEKYKEGLGGIDDDMKIRAERLLMRIHWLDPEKAFAAHQWHPISDMKGKLSHMFVLEPDIVKNAGGWGEIK